MNGPTSLDEFIGQDNAKTQIETAMIRARAMRRPLEHVLITGRSGLGKTEFAKLIAKTSDLPFDSMYWPPATQQVLARRLIEAEGVILLDEIHKGGKGPQEWLYGAVRPGGGGEVQYASGRKVELENLTIIGATTDPDAVSGPLRRRFMLELDFRPYTEQEIGLIFMGKVERAKVPLWPKDVITLAKACAGRPAMAERLVTAAQGLAIQYGTVDANAVLEHLQLDGDGLEHRHRLYLTTMSHIQRTTDKAVGLDVMANAMQLSGHAVEDTERLLQQLGYLFVGLATGREMTRLGDARVAQIKEDWGI